MRLIWANLCNILIFSICFLQVRQMLEMEFNKMLAVATERRVESDLPKS